MKYLNFAKIASRGVDLWGWGGGSPLLWCRLLNNAFFVMRL